MKFCSRGYRKEKATSLENSHDAKGTGQLFCLGMKVYYTEVCALRAFIRTKYMDENLCTSIYKLHIVENGERK